ncbi:MAG: T9SS type A sorting domain-containing protein [Bacteroidetes bacterium]|nr:T9SS type A sorting domain-containing protein [Bacteroidota bacterium]
MSSFNNTIDVSHLSAGVYIIELKSATETMTARFIKKLILTTIRHAYSNAAILIAIALNILALVYKFSHPKRSILYMDTI